MDVGACPARHIDLSTDSTPAGHWQSKFRGMASRRAPLSRRIRPAHNQSSKRLREELQIGFSVPGLIRRSAERSKAAIEADAGICFEDQAGENERPLEGHA